MREKQLIKSGIKIQHAMAGRIRFKIPAIHYNGNKPDGYEQCFGELKGIRWIEVRPKSASLIVRYDHRLVGRNDVVEKLMGKKSILEKKAPPMNQASRVNGKESIKSGLARFIGLTLLVGIVLVREVIFKRPLAQSFFSPLGLVTSLAALPLMKKGVEKIKEGRLTLENFLGGSILAAVGAGQASAALGILWITSGAGVLQGWITERSRRAIRDILQVTEKETYVFIGGVEVSIPVEKVKIGDTVVLHTGEKIAVDGETVKGEALINDAPINGRSELVARNAGGKVFAGTFVRQGVIFVKAQQVGDRTYLARILAMVEDSLLRKAPIEAVATSWQKRW